MLASHLIYVCFCADMQGKSTSHSSHSARCCSWSQQQCKSPSTCNIHSSANTWQRALCVRAYQCRYTYTTVMSYYVVPVCRKRGTIFVVAFFVAALRIIQSWQSRSILCRFDDSERYFLSLFVLPMTHDVEQ